MATYRRPGVYLEETILPGPNDVGSAESTLLFVGAADRGPTSPIRCNSWADYTASFGDFTPPVGASISYLPYAVYSFFRNGGRVAYVARSVASGGSGEASEFVVCDHDTLNDAVDFNAKEIAFKVVAKSDGTWGDDLGITITAQDVSSGPNPTKVFTLTVFRRNSIGNYTIVETFRNLSVAGDIPGTRKAVDQINDQVYGSAYIRLADYDPQVVPEDLDDPVTAALFGGIDGGLPSDAEIANSLLDAAEVIDTPLVVNATGYQKDNGDYVLPVIDPARFPADRQDIFVINDATEPRQLGISSADYANTLVGGELGTGSGSSYIAAYAPWITIANPAETRGTVLIPPGGAVAGVYARTDATRGIFQTPAGTNAVINNAISTDAKFSTTEQGNLNAAGINVIRAVPNSGITIMGGRTKKQYGVDRYIAARRTLIYIKESLKASTQFAVFENNSEALWGRLRAAAENILRPVWLAGGLRGGMASEAYFVVCDDSINTPSVIASGEVRMNVGVALEYPAEFIVIQISQFDAGSLLEAEIG